MIWVFNSKKRTLTISLFCIAVTFIFMQVLVLNQGYSFRVTPNLILVPALTLGTYQTTNPVRLHLRTIGVNDNTTTDLPFQNFSYPLEVNMTQLVELYKQNNGSVGFKPINVYKHKFMSYIPHKCRITKPISLLLMVKSAIPNFQRRQVVRETWGNESFFENISMKTVFVIGNPENITIQCKIEAEKAKYNDIVQIDYRDSYYNNTLKTIGAIRWISHYCQNAKFAIITDDDFYVATDLLVQYLNSLKDTDSLFMGRVWDDIPQRGKFQKWYMPVQDYPFDKYPPFISAGATIMSMKVVIDFDIAIRFTKKFKFDDVFLAIVAYKLGIKAKHHDKVFISNKVKHGDKGFNTVLASHKYSNETELRQAWRTHTRGMLPRIRKTQ